MSLFRRFEVTEPSSSLFFRDTSSIFTTNALALPRYFPSFPFDDEFNHALDLLNPSPAPALVEFASPFSDFDTIADLIQIERTPFYTSTRRVQHQVDRFCSESYLRSLSDRVTLMELRFDRLLKGKIQGGDDGKYTWGAEIKGRAEKCYGGVDRKYKFTAEIKGGGERKKECDKGGVEKKYKWTAEIKDGSEESPITRTYAFKASSGGGVESRGSEKNEMKKDKVKKAKGEKGIPSVRVLEIEEPSDHGAVVLRQAFARRAGAPENSRGKRKELSRQDAAMMIQIAFRAYLIRTSQALRALRELAVAKTKLKELRLLFNNFAYRRHLTRDAEERQRFTEKIIVLLLTVDAIEGADLTVRAAKRSMVCELEAMLDVVDPQPSGKGRLLKRRTFDMPDGVIRKEIADGVVEVVQLVGQERGMLASYPQ